MVVIVLYCLNNTFIAIDNIVIYNDLKKCN